MLRLALELHQLQRFQEDQPSLDIDLDLITKNMAVDEATEDAAIMAMEEMLYTVLTTIIRSIRMVMAVEPMEATD